MGVNAQALPRVLIDYRENAEPPAVGELITHQIHAPALVGPYRLRQGNPAVRGPFGTLASSHLQTFLAIQPINALGIDDPPFAPQPHRQPAVAVSHSAPSQVP